MESMIQKLAKSPTIAKDSGDVAALIHKKMCDNGLLGRDMIHFANHFLDKVIETLSTEKEKPQ